MLKSIDRLLEKRLNKISKNLSQQQQAEQQKTADICAELKQQQRGMQKKIDRLESNLTAVLKLVQKQQVI